MTDHLNKTADSFKSGDEVKGGLKTLERIAACVPVLVEAGCDAPKNIDIIQGVLILDAGGTRTSFEEDPKWLTTVLFSLKGWFAETVVPHFSPAMHKLDPPFYDSDDGWWYWRVHDDSGWCPGPTVAFVQCLEALTEVVKAGAQEAEGERGGG
jgi:hypothetical protein